MAVFKEDGLMPKGASLSEAPWSLSSKIKKVVGNSRGVGSYTHTLWFILTNTGSLTTPQLYSTLRISLRHHPETLTGIRDIAMVKSRLQTATSLTRNLNGGGDTLTPSSTPINVRDHWPFMMTLSPSDQNGPPATPPTNWNRKMLNPHSIDLALSESWVVFKTDSIESEEDLSTPAEKWVKTLNSIGKELDGLGAQSDCTLVRKLKTILIQDQNRAKLAIKKFEKQTKLRHSQIINSLILAGEAADFHRTFQLAQGRVKGGDDNLPSADPIGISQEKEAWKHIKANNSYKVPLRIRTHGSSNEPETQEKCNLLLLLIITMAMR
ncbi:hypothetical protein VP01_1713g2 [Puccinia sorghi]|uniref:Uncharacterized protein n=1 Tax=Puccinia sorghi TaxID=27349 RepID=A0A0L6VFF3_9BASI|nr:hypothetical protein VP01_1713g2 [Puccinia sorghi]